MVSKMLWHLLKYYLCFVIAVFFKRSQVKNAKYLKVKGPVILAVNHPNAFMDPVALTTLVYPPRLYYLARGDAFKKGIITFLLESLGIIPIFRLQDGGKDGLKKNDETYKRVNYLLNRNKKIIIFAEGICIQERRLRPLKKGVARMVFGAMESLNENNLTVVPVGINYTNPSHFRGSIFCNVGKPIPMVEYMNSYSQAPAKIMNQFLADLTASMKNLIIHINDKHNEDVIKHLEEIYKSNYFKKHHYQTKNLEYDFLFSNYVVDVINKQEEIQPDVIKQLKTKTTLYFKELQQYQLKDWLINPHNSHLIHSRTYLIRLFLICLSFPIYISGVLGSYLPYKLTNFITSKKVKKNEFKDSFNMGIGALLFLINYIIIFSISKLLFQNIWIALFTVCILIICSWVCLYLSPFRKKTWGISRVLKLKLSNPDALNRLTDKRKEIIALFEALT